MDMIIIVLGAALDADGRPGPAMLRRTKAAASLAREGVHYLLSGGCPGDAQCSEAGAMRSLLEGEGVRSEQIMLEDSSRNTFENVINCTRLLRGYAHDVTRLVVCSDDIHLPRARLLFRVAGLSVAAHAVVRDPEQGRARRLRAYVHEGLAMLRDVPELLVLRALRKI